MNPSPSELAGVLCRCQAGVEAALRQGASRQERAAGLADLLRTLLPAADRTACLLRAEAGTSLEIRTAGGPLDPAQGDLLRSRLESLDPLAAGVQTLAPAAQGGLRIRAAAIHEAGRPRGFLAIGLADDATAEVVARAEAILTVCAPAVALRWVLDALGAEHEELARFALVGQAFLGLAHELNNALNSMMLQTSVVQLRVDPQAHGGLNVIRQHGALAAGLVRSFQHVVQERRQKSYAVDLNDAALEVLEEEPALRQAVSVQLAEQAPRIQGTRGAVKQLIRLVLQGIHAGTTSALRLQTQKPAEGAALIVLLAAPPPEPAGEGAASSADTLVWQHLDEVGRQAGKSLLRQLGGEMTVERDHDGGAVVRVAWGDGAAGMGKGV
jgi:signal transduction histidine kinase